MPDDTQSAAHLDTAQASHVSNAAMFPLILGQHTSSKTPRLSHNIRTQGNSESEIICEDALTYCWVPS